MRRLTVSLLNINEPDLTIDILNKLAVLAQQDWQMQLILVDNASESDRLQPLFDWYLTNRHHFDELLFVAASRNLGATGGRNAVYKLTTNDYILVLDNDVILPHNSDWLNTLWQRMETDGRIGVVAPVLTFANYPHIVQGAGIGLTAQGRVGYLERGKLVSEIPTGPLEVVASPSACWLLRTEAQRAVGLLADEFYPVQYEDVDLCVRLGLTGWKTVCERRVRIQHIENVTTRNLQDHPFARLTARQAIRFKEKWADILPKIATMTEDEIYWGPIPRSP
jgi:GT2 family glycosyltransferase